jgi:hypothetical protein
MARTFGRDYTIGGSGGGVENATSNSMIGGGDVPLTKPDNKNVSVTVSISAPIAGIIEGAAALGGTVPQNYGITVTPHLIGR